MKSMKLSGTTGECNLIIGGSINQLQNYYKEEKVVIITDKNIQSLHSNSFPKCDIIEIEVGEKSKTLETVQDIYQRFLELEVDRSSLIVGIGGGVVCDVTGFAASTYMRGVNFGFVPTTLLAQVDAGIGGKNGVNFKEYKNLIGVFKQPKFCLFDFDLLKTLPRQELRCGFAEIIKHAAIGNYALFTYLEDNCEAALSLKKEVIERVVYDSLNVKAKIVAIDETEKRERMKLNFGHTIGHAIEKATGLRHGEAISIGMVVAANLSVAKGLLTKSNAERIKKLLENFGLPTKLKISHEVIFDAIKRDKKRRGKQLNMALLEDIGKVTIREIKFEELKGVLDDLC